MGSTDNEFMEGTQNICRVRATKLLSICGCDQKTFSGLTAHSGSYIAGGGLCVPTSCHWLPCEMFKFDPQFIFNLLILKSTFNPSLIMSNVKKICWQDVNEYLAPS